MYNFGEIIGIVGNNGVGKSTFLSSLVGLEKKMKLNIFLDGKKLRKKDLISMSSLVMQDVNKQLFTESVEIEVSMNRNLKSEEIDEVLKKMSLLELKERHPHSLSGGQKQRVAILEAILSKANILCFDEPTSGMDYTNMLNISKLIKSISSKENIIFVVSHDTEFLNITADKILDLEKIRL